MMQTLPCKICLSPTKLISSFGKMPRANALLNTPKEEEFFYHLAVVFCPSCYMVQLNECVKPSMMFNENYSFISSTSNVMMKHFEEVSQEILDKLPAQQKNSFVIELGCNDGIMLQHIASKGISHIGIEPSLNVAQMAKEKGVHVENIFFNDVTAKNILAKYGHADAIFGANVTCHIEDLNPVFKGAASILKDDGVFFFEDPYLLDIVKLSSFDQIYDAHIYFFSTHSVSQIAKHHGLQLVDVAHQEVHGGSMRYYLKKGGHHKISPTVEASLAEEKQHELHQVKGYEKLSENINRICFNLKDTLLKIKREGYSIAGYGATAKSSTLLNSARIGTDIIDYICDITPTKIDKYTPGMHIPIKSHEYFLSNPPDYVLLFAWNHKKEIMQKETSYVNRGGKFITYFPEVTIF